MTVKELIKKLENVNPDAKVYTVHTDYAGYHDNLEERWEVERFDLCSRDDFLLSAAKEDNQRDMDILREDSVRSGSSWCTDNGCLERKVQET